MSEFSRRSVLGMGSAMALAAGVARAADIAPASDTIAPAADTIALWPGKAPGDIGTVITRRIEERSHDPSSHDRWIFGVARPELVVFRPARPNGSAALVIPGGSYVFVAYDNEGAEQARWLNALGVTVFVLFYRLPSEGWARREDVPLQDAQRAMRIIRRDAQRFGVDPTKIAVLGFSAGGHLAGLAALAPGGGADDTVDFAVLGYAITSMETETYRPARMILLGEDATPQLRRETSLNTLVTESSPPFFLWHTAEDPYVPPEHTYRFAASLAAHAVPHTAHVFAHGPHSLGLARGSGGAAAWTGLAASWIDEQRHGGLPLARRHSELHPRGDHEGPV